MLFSHSSRVLHRRSRASRRGRARASRFAFRPDLSFLENRLALTGNIAVTNAFLVDANEQSLTALTAGEDVRVQVDFTTEDLPANASYRIAYTLNGVTRDSEYVTFGAGRPGISSWHDFSPGFIASPAANQVSVIIDPDNSVPNTNQADAATSFSATAALPAVGNLSYSVSQIRTAYGINSIPSFGSAPADGSGQTIAVVDHFNDPTILSDLDGFDEAMHLTTNSSPTLYQQYGPASSLLTVYNTAGKNITAHIADSGNKKEGVPPVDPTGSWEGEETLDVEWAHAIAPGAKIDIVECNGRGKFGGLFRGAATAARLRGVSVVSMSWGFKEGMKIGVYATATSTFDSRTFVTPRGHRGVTFLASSGDGGTPNGFPSLSPNVISVGGTQTYLNGDAYGTEIGWSYPAPQTFKNGTASYSQTGSWTSQPGGYSGTYSTAAAASNNSATWTTPIGAADAATTAISRCPQPGCPAPAMQRTPLTKSTQARRQPAPCLEQCVSIKQRHRSEPSKAAPISSIWAPLTRRAVL